MQALTALADGRSFTPNIDQAVCILEIQDAVYDHARRSLLTNGPIPWASRRPARSTSRHRVSKATRPLGVQGRTGKTLRAIAAHI